MFDNRYNEHPDFDRELLLKPWEQEDIISMMGHDLYYAGYSVFDNELDESYEYKIFFIKESTNDNTHDWNQAIGVITEVLKDKPLLLKTGHFEMALEMGDIFPLDRDNIAFPIEKTIYEMDWTTTDPYAHVTKIGGYPSFGEDADYGQPHTQDLDGILVPIPFLGQVILPDGRYLHAYSVDGIREYDEYADSFEVPYSENHGTFVIIQGEPIDEKIVLKPEEHRITLSEVAHVTADGYYPTFTYYLQGGETTDEYPYTLFHFPGAHAFDGNVPANMATYTDAYMVWNGKDKAMLVEQYG